jgi:hypothetical protein
MEHPRQANTDCPRRGGSASEIGTPLLQLTNTTDITIRDIILDGSRTAYRNDGFTGPENGGMHCIRVRSVSMASAMSSSLVGL